MQLSHKRPLVAAVFDESNFVSAAGLLPADKGAGRLRGGEAASGPAPDARGVAWLRRTFR